MLDDTSRAVAGYAVFLGAPSALNLSLALRQPIWRKTEPGWAVADREQAFLDRREALADAADEFRRLARTSWPRPLAAFGLGTAGSAVTLACSNPIGAGLTADGALLGLRRQADPASAYTYLFQAQQRLSAEYRR